jgi:2,4-dienoyl-CoA reductase (NADPH2)
VAQAFPGLFSPLAIGRLTLANRIVMLPHGTSMIADGALTDHDIAYYERRARSRPGMMITGASVVSPDSTRRGRKLLENYSDHALPGLTRRAEQVKAHGVAMVGQLIHLGRESIGADTDHPLRAPSPIRSPRDQFRPHELDEDEIAGLVADFTRSALNLRRTGHDGVELHGAHGYLIAQFLSPATNHRTDSYGGNHEARLRFLRELIDAIRTACGHDFVLGLRLSADEEIGDGLELSDTRRIVERLAQVARVDYLSVTLGVRGAYVKDVTQPEATAARAAAILREASGFVTIAGQRITSPAIAERVLDAGQADAIGCARAFVADPDWVAKAAAGEPETIRPCIGLNQDCRAFAPHLHCAVNPLTGREADPRLTSADPPAHSRTIAVVGGGPAGMEAARIAAGRGHHVTLFEASDGLGGQFLLAAAVPGRAPLARLLDYQQRALRRAHVEVRLGTRIEAAHDLRGAFDAVVVATGAEPLPLDAAVSGPAVLRWDEILRDGAPAPVGNGQAIVADDGTGFWWTYGVANALVDAGWRVALVTPAPALAHAIPAESLAPLLGRLARGPTEYRVLAQVIGLADGGAELMAITTGATEICPADLIVIQTGRRPVAPELGAQTAASEFHRIGDCVSPRRLSNALLDAHFVANRL